jgi:hypothetical protein
MIRFYNQRKILNWKKILLGLRGIKEMIKLKIYVNSWAVS